MKVVSPLKISVVTPSFNQAQFLPFNLSSVKAQNYQDVEHIIVDPGSTDGSREIARAGKDAVLIAEPDRGQSDGITKGFARATGDILAWLNSDDFYPHESVLARVAQAFEAHPDADIIYGNVDFVDESGKFLRRGYVNPDAGNLFESFAYQVGIVQPGVFMRRAVFDKLGGPSEQYEYCMDYEYWVRMAAAGLKWVHLDEKLAHHRWWGGMKTSRGREDSLIEHLRVNAHYFGYIHWKWIDRFAEYLSSRQDGVVNHAASVDPHLKAEHAKELVHRYVTQDMLRRLRSGGSPEHAATLDYVHKRAPDLGVYFADASDVQISLETSDDPDAVNRIAWRIFRATDSNSARYYAYHVPQNFDRYFDADWCEATFARSCEKLTTLAVDRRETCVIVGNGPSLKHADLSLLRNADVIISNFAVMNSDLLSAAKIVTVTNDLVAKQGSIDFNRIRKTKIFPFWVANSINETPETAFVPATVEPTFCSRIDGVFSWRSTVSYFNLQIAFALGYKKVLMIGFDHSYAQPGDVKEGDVIYQKEDDENHFDPRYFKGKSWQAADTVKMEKMYRLAKDAFEADGREIVNCTVGGKLELFRRGDLSSELKTAVGHEPPRLLLIDLTRLGDVSATGQLKAQLFADWPPERLAQVYQAPDGKVAFTQIGETVTQEANPGVASLISDAVDAFGPDVVLYRPTPDTPALHAVAMHVIQSAGKPLVTWIMDDWPVSLAMRDPTQAAFLVADWEGLLKRSSERLSISDAMSTAFEQRYGTPFTAVANGVDPADWPERLVGNNWNPASAKLRVRYAGSLAENMTLHAVKRIAEAVEILVAEGVDIDFEIKTRTHWRTLAQPHFDKLKRTRFIVADLSPEEYREWLSKADIVVIGYNFDQPSRNYIRYSLANKLPECLASGAPLLAVGPAEAATMKILEETDCGVRVTVDDPAAVAEALRRLGAAPAMRQKLAAHARSVAFDRFNVKTMRKILKDKLSAAAADIPGLTRAALAQVDETAVVAHLLADRKGAQHIMLDIGAHFGTSAAYFDDLGWTIHCFEPDPKNREKLAARFGSSERVFIDKRAVSDRQAEGVSFFSSSVSTGISGLSAFHDSHKETGRVDVTTIKEIISTREIDRTDFLKIDVEGFDFAVLKGVPWDRFKPDVIECEFEDAKTIGLGHSWRDIAEFLRARGYSVYISEWHPIVRYGVAHDWRRVVRYPEVQRLPSDAWGNLLAFRSDPGIGAVRSAFAACLKSRAPDGVIDGGRRSGNKSATASGCGARAGTAADNLNDELCVKGSGLTGSIIEGEGASPVRRTDAYIAFAHGVHKAFPAAYAPMRFVKRAFAHVWRRRVWTIPLALVFFGLAASAFHPALSAQRTTILLSIGVSSLAISIAYFAFRLHGLAERLNTENLDVRNQLAQSRREASALASANKNLARDLKNLNGDVVSQKTSVLAQSENSVVLAGKVKELNGLIADALRELRTDISATTQKTEGYDKALRELRSEIGAFNQRYGGLEELIAKLDANATAAQALAAAAPPNNASLYQRFNRRLSAQHIEEFTKEWRKRLSLNTAPATLGYMATRACQVEAALEGRLATSIEDMLLRTLVCFGVKRRDLEVLEIGTLFGVGAAIMYDAVKPHFETVHFTLLDPLDGYYDAAQKDILTGQPVNEAGLRRNLSRVGASDKQITLIKRLSTEPEAIDEAAKRQYDILVIDGDHSYAGVKTDFDNYAPMVKLGGYIVIDDYGSPDWPDVRRFVDDEAAKRDDVTHVGTSWRTCVYRVVKRRAD